MGEKARLEELWKKHPNTFRFDSGSGYVGGREFVAKKDGAVQVKKGDVVVVNPKRITYGIPGAGDRVGWTETIVTDDMIGKKVAVFTSIEDKSATDRIGVNQLIFLLNVLRAGGIALVYREGVKLTLDEALELPRRKSTERDDRILERLK